MSNQFDLTDLDNVSGFADTQVPDIDGDVPDGKYTAFVDHVELTRTKTDKRRLSWRLKIIGPSHVGRCVFTGHLLETPQNLAWLKKDLQTCGFQLSNWSELPNRLEDLLDIVLEIQVKTRGEFTNAYLKRRIELAEGVNPRDLAEAGAGSDASAVEVGALFDEDVPF
ncbi:MAG: DUF669 domain-containing protein [Planctomycetota bacterium]